MYTFIWLALVVVFVIAEFGTVALVSVWFALGAFAAMLVSMFRVPLTAQIIVFLAVSAASLILLYPRIRKKVESNRTRTNADRILGMQAVVTENIDPIAGTGCVKVDGKMWSARSADGSGITEGKLVRVLRIEGVRAIVEEIHS